MMLSIFLALFGSFMAPAVLPTAPVPAPFGWLAGTWRSEALEMICTASDAGTACHEQGVSAAMQGAKADLTITPADGAAGAQLKVELPQISASTYREVAREPTSITFAMPTKMGVARLRFTREGDVLKVERGDASSWRSSMVYRKS